MASRDTAGTQSGRTTFATAEARLPGFAEAGPAAPDGVGGGVGGGTPVSRRVDPAGAAPDVDAARNVRGVGVRGSPRSDFMVGVDGSTGMAARGVAPKGISGVMPPPADDAGGSTPGSRVDRGSTESLVKASARPPIATSTMTVIFPISRMPLLLCPAYGPRRTWPDRITLQVSRPVPSSGRHPNPLRWARLTDVRGGWNPEDFTRRRRPCDDRSAIADRPNAPADVAHGPTPP